MSPQEPGPTHEDMVRHARERLHVYEGLGHVASDPHGVLDVIVSSGDVDEARAALRARYGVDDVQADALLDVQFRRATGRDRSRLAQEADEISAHLASLGED